MILKKFMSALFFFKLDVSSEHCNGDDTKTEDCNNCVCANGKWACTRKLCHSVKRGNFN